MTNLTPELLEKVKLTKSSEELLSLAKENGIELTAEQAKAYYDQFHKTGELEDDELDNVAGGGCHASDGRLVVTVGNLCTGWVCKKCYQDLGNRTARNSWDWHYCREEYGGSSHGACCNTCYYCSYEGGLWLCNHPGRR